MKNIMAQFILIFLLACSGGGPGSSSFTPSSDSKIKAEYTKVREVSPREFLSVLNLIPILKERGSFVATSNLEYKQGSITCVGKTELKVLFNKETNRSSVYRKVTQTGGNCKGVSPIKNYQTKKEFNLNFLYKLINFKNVKISEGALQGKRAYMISNEEKEQTTVYLLSVEEESLDSLQSEFIYLENDGYIKIRTKIYPTADTKIEENLIESTPETGDLLELSEYPLYDLIG